MHHEIDALVLYFLPKHDFVRCVSTTGCLWRVWSPKALAICKTEKEEFLLNQHIEEEARRKDLEASIEYEREERRRERSPTDYDRLEGRISFLGRTNWNWGSGAVIDNGINRGGPDRYMRLRS